MEYKYSVLTFIFGKYDMLREPVEIDPECEYVCVTDDPGLASTAWRVVCTDRFTGKCPIYASFYVRWHPFEFVATDRCIVVDASIWILRRLDRLVEDVLDAGYALGTILQRYGKDTSIEKLKYWHDERDLGDDEYVKCRAYIDERWNTKYRGYIEATVRVLKNDPVNTEINRRVWEDCLMLGTGGNPVRLDELPYSIIMQTEFKNVKTAKYDRKLIQGSFMRFCHHGKPIPWSMKLSHQKYAYWCNHHVAIKELK